jgi:hypothetical protein
MLLRALSEQKVHQITMDCRFQSPYYSMRTSVDAVIDLVFEKRGIRRMLDVFVFPIHFWILCFLTVIFQSDFFRAKRMLELFIVFESHELICLKIISIPY